jgi:hypothetical protein
MTAIRCCAVLALVLSVVRPAGAEDEGLDVTVMSPRGMPIQVVEFTIDEVTQTVRLDPAQGRGSTHFSGPVFGPAQVTFRVAVGDPRLVGKRWSTGIPLNGSGHLEYQILENGRGESKQWPLVRWLSTGDSLDVTLNGATLGSTERRKGVSPNQQHQSAWLRDGRPVCRNEFTLDYNVVRTYRCDPATGKVSQR